MTISNVSRGTARNGAKRILFAFVFLCASWVQAAPYSDSWISVRGMGMGNAYTSVVSDSDALFYNPASLARINSFSWTIFDMHAGLDDLKAEQVYQQFESAKGSTSSLASFINNQYGQSYWFGAGAKTAVTLPYAGFAVFGNSDLSMSVSNPPYPQLDLNYFLDYGFVLGGAVTLDPLNIVSVGMSVKRINRDGSSSPISATTLSSLNFSSIQQQLTNRGVGYSVDSGVNFTLPTPIQPTLSVVYHDMGRTSFSHTGGYAAPESIDPNLAVGGSLDISAPLITVTPAIEFDQLTTKNISAGKRLHLGVETAFPLLDFRAGLNQGYYTLGAGVNLGLMRVDAATYGVELGQYAGQKEDRRYVVQLTIELGLPLPHLTGDPDSDSAGARRWQLKQRR